MHLIPFDRALSLSEGSGISRQARGARSGAVRPLRPVHTRVISSNDGQDGSVTPEAVCHSTRAERQRSVEICHSVCVCSLVFVRELP